LNLVRLHRGLADLRTRQVRQREGVTGITRIEAELLAWFARHPDQVVSKDRLLEEVWGYRAGVRSRTVEVTIYTLRRKIERDPTRPEHLLTERGGGYRFVPLASEPSLDPDARRLARLLEADALSYDAPASALAALDDISFDAEVQVRRAALLVAVGALGEADEALAASIGVEDPRRALVAASLALRRGTDPVAWLQRAMQGDPLVAATAMVRLGVYRLDRGDVHSGFGHLADARLRFERLDAHRLLAMAWGEEGLYRVLQGRPDAALEAFDGALEDQSGSRYVERVTRFGKALALRLAGGDADVERQRAEGIAVERWDEPGVFAFRALERRIAGEDATALVAEGLERHALRPNPADAALLEALRSSDDALASLVRHGPAFALTLFRAARGSATPMAGQVLMPALVGAFRPTTAGAPNR
jgi:DNA-binding winged helix-turn-helix (wHTH) protein